MAKREFRQPAKRGKTKRWIIWQVKNEVSIQHGLQGGKMVIPTTTTLDSVNVGKANEKSAKEVATEWMERQILKKTRAGYREVDPKTGKFLEHVPEAEDSLTKFSDLPQNLRFYKPLNSMNAYMQKMMDARTAWWLRKRDGNMHAYVVDEKGKHRLYTGSTTPHQKDEPDREILERYPHIELAMNELAIPPRSIILGEICCVSAGGFADDDGFDVDDLDLVNGIRGGLTETALETQREHGCLGFCVWDIAFWNKKCLLHTMKAGERFTDVMALADQDSTGWVTFPEIARWDPEKKHIHVDSPTGPFDITELEDRTVEQVLIDLAKDFGWEGWVVVDPESTYGEKGYNFRGKAERPKQSAKLKRKFESDFIIRWDPDNGIGKRGKGKKSVGVGSVQAYLIHPERGEIEISLVGGGMTEKNVLELADPSIYPQVAVIEYASWTKSGSLQFPEFLRLRDDKPMDECTVDQNPNWEEHYAEK